MDPHSPSLNIPFSRPDTGDALSNAGRPQPIPERADKEQDQRCEESRYALKLIRALPPRDMKKCIVTL